MLPTHHPQVEAICADGLGRLSGTELIADLFSAVPAARAAAPLQPMRRMKFAPPHSTSSSALARIVEGTARPSALAVLRLMTSSNFPAWTTGNSAGLVPCRIRPVYIPS